jgi:hypothetical protein
MLFTLLIRPGSAQAVQPRIINDPAYPSAITITDGTMHGSSVYQIPVNVTCVAFVNNGPKTATKVGLNLAYVDPDGVIMGVDVYFPRGKFPVGVRSAFSGPNEPNITPNGNCQKSFAGRSNVPGYAYEPGKGGHGGPIAAILVSAREIVYDDGTAFRTDSGPHTGDHVVLPPLAPPAVIVATGPPVFAASSDASPLEIIGDVGYGADHQVYVGFTNRAAIMAKHILINLALVDRTGKIVGLNEMNIVGTFSPNLLITTGRGSIVNIPGTLDGDAFMYDADSGRVAIGRIIAMPVRIEYADGTSWDAPHPAKVGDTLTHV